MVTRSTEETKEILHVKWQIKLWAVSCKALQTGFNPKTIYRAKYSYLYNDIHYSGTPVNRPDSLTLMAFCRQHCHTSLLSNALWCSNSWPHCTLPTLQSLFLFYTFTTSKYVHELFQNNTRVTQLRTFTNKYMQQLYDTCRGKEDLFVCFLHTSIKRDRTVTNSQNLLKVNTRSTEETKEILHVKIKLWAVSCKALQTGFNPKTIYRAKYSYLYNDIHYSGTPVNRPDSLTLMAFCRQHCHTSLLSNALWCSNSWPHCTLPTLQSLFFCHALWAKINLPKQKNDLSGKIRKPDWSGLPLLKVPVQINY